MLFFFTIYKCISPIEAQTDFCLPASINSLGILALHNDLMLYLLIICTFVLWMLLTIIFRFRSVNNWKNVYQNFYAFGVFHPKQAKLEFVWALLPALIVISIAIPSFTLLYAMSELKSASVNIKIIGNQWYWTYEHRIRRHLRHDQYTSFNSYLLDLETVIKKRTFRLLAVDKHLKMPINTNVRLLVTSTDVLHSWTIPAFGVKLDACPGRLNSTIVRIQRPGTYYGQCSEICGVNHGFMPIMVEVGNWPKML